MHQREALTATQFLNPTDVAIFVRTKLVLGSDHPAKKIRDVHDEELEGVWAGKTSVADALKRIVQRDNELLRQFEQANK